MEVPDNREQIYGEVKEETNFVQISGIQSLQIKLEVRGCISGESMLSNGKCYHCQPGTYLIEHPEEPVPCKKCQDEVSMCLGGSEIYPKPNYWRSSNTSDNFIKCINEKACLGHMDNSSNPFGDCAEGYSGIVCSQCEPGYSKNDNTQECLKCPSKTSNTALLVIFILVMALIIVILVRSNLRSANQEKNYLPVFFRILLNHLQVLTLTASFDFEWPEELVTFFRGIQPVSEASSQILSINCFIGDKSIKTNDIFIVKNSVMAVLPLIMIILAIIVWYLILLFQHTKKSMKTAKIQVQIKSP